MDKVKALLQLSQCADYVSTFEELGYDSAAHLLSMGPDDFKELGRNCNMNPGHLHRFKNVCAAWKEKAHDLQLSLVPHARGPTHGVVASAGIGAAAAASVTLGPSDLGNNKNGPTVEDALKQHYPEWKDALLASYRYSTAAGFSAGVDKRKSGSSYKTIRCRAMVSKRQRGRDDEGPDECPHVLVWSKKKRLGNKWVLNEKKSHFKHVPFCSSQQEVKKLELTQDPIFVKGVTIDNKCTGKKAARQALGGETGRLDGSIDIRTARRARNDILRHTDKDYEADWCKLSGWKREYERKNSESRCVIGHKLLANGTKM